MLQNAWLKNIFLCFLYFLFWGQAGLKVLLYLNAHIKFPLCFKFDGVRHSVGINDDPYASSLFYHLKCLLRKILANGYYHGHCHWGWWVRGHHPLFKFSLWPHLFKVENVTCLLKFLIFCLVCLFQFSLKEMHHIKTRSQQ